MWEEPAKIINKFNIAVGLGLTLFLPQADTNNIPRSRYIPTEKLSIESSIEENKHGVKYAEECYLRNFPSQEDIAVITPNENPDPSATKVQRESIDLPVIKSCSSYKSMPKGFFNPLINVLKEAIDESERGNERNTKIFGQMLQLIQKGLQGENKGVVIGNIDLLLRKKDKTVNDPRIKRIQKALNKFSNIYRVDNGRFNPNEPTMILLPGANRGVFDTYDCIIKRFQGDNNIFVFVPNYLTSMDQLAALFFEKLRRVKEVYHIDGAILIVAHSQADSYFRISVLNYYKSGIFDDIYLCRLAPPIGGSNCARWMEKRGLRFLCRVFLDKPIFDIGVFYNPYGRAQKLLYGNETNELFRKVIPEDQMVTYIVGVNDIHNPPTIIDFLKRKSKFKDVENLLNGVWSKNKREYLERFLNGLGKTYTVIENNHYEITFDDAVIKGVKDILNDICTLIQDKKEIEEVAKVDTSMNKR